MGLRINSLELFVVVAWFIWNHRNRLRLSEKGLATDRIFEAARTYLSDFQVRFPKTTAKATMGNIKWRPPVSATYKTNYDSAVFIDSGEAGIGVVVRNARGEVMAALSKKISYPGTVELLKALAARRAAKFAIELGISSSEFEGDYEVVCGALKAVEWGHPSLGQIIKDTWPIVSSLRTVSFSHTRQ